MQVEELKAKQKRLQEEADGSAKVAAEEQAKRVQQAEEGQAKRVQQALQEASGFHQHAETVIRREGENHENHGDLGDN